MRKLLGLFLICSLCVMAGAKETQAFPLLPVPSIEGQIAMFIGGNVLQKMRNARIHRQIQRDMRNQRRNAYRQYLHQRQMEYHHQMMQQMQRGTR